MTELTNERADFEAWAELTDHQKHGALHDVTGWYYFDEVTQDRWEAWQAARRATPSSECALPPLPKPSALGCDGAEVYYGYTAEQVEQIRREAVEADRRARPNILSTPLAEVTDRLAREAAENLSLKMELRALEAKLARQSQEPQAERDGWKWVPVDLTDDMAVAFAETWFSKVRPIDDCGMEDCYAAMLAAAPAHPVAQPAPTQPMQQQANVLPPTRGTEGQHDASDGETLDQKAENALLWCYRRLKNSYGRLPFVEDAIAGLRARTATAGPARQGGHGATEQSALVESAGSQPVEQQDPEDDPLLRRLRQRLAATPVAYSSTRFDLAVAIDKRVAELRAEAAQHQEQGEG